MKLQLYYPSRQGAQTLWLRNFQNKLPGYATTLGLTPEVLASALNDLFWILYFQCGLPANARRYALACTAAAKNLMSGEGNDLIVVPPFDMPELPAGIPLVKAGALDRIFNLVQTIKFT